MNGITNIGGGKPNIKSIQRGTVLYNNQTSATISVANYDLNSSVIRLKFNATQTLFTYFNFRIKKVSSNLFQILTTTAGNTYTTVSWELIEYNNVKSLQTVSVNVVSAENNISILPVNVNKTLIFSYLSITSASQFDPTYSFYSELLTTDNIFIKRKAGLSGFYEATVIEFK